MKKVILILIAGLLLSGNAYAGWFDKLPVLACKIGDQHITYDLRKVLDTNWRDQKFSWVQKEYKDNMKKPKNLKQMLKVVKKLASSTNFEFVRVDTYTNNISFHIGEFTHIPGNAAAKFYPASSEIKASKIIFS